jgi:hypothetical protein
MTPRQALLSPLRRVRDVSRSKPRPEAVGGSRKSAGEVDESEIGSANGTASFGRSFHLCDQPQVRVAALLHLRAPSIDHGVQSFLWAVVFFLFLWFGMLAIGVSSATSFVLSLVLGAGIFLFIRIFGEDDLALPEAREPRRRLP